MTPLEIQQWSQKTAEILDAARQAITASPTPAVQSMEVQLPATAAADDAPLSLAFAGQYSAGKSTLISALTGQDDIAIGADITTDATHRYNWNDVIVIDTPGIHTSVRPDHDLTTYAAISGADLLVFVITNELFDSHIAENYRKLTVDHDKGHEAILVVNKMGRHADGNTEESRAVITEDLRAPLAPFTPEDLKITFTDAADALEAREETDPEFREMLEEQGNLSGLVANINAFVAEKGLTARYTTVLYQVEQVLEDASAAEPTDDPDLDALVLVYNQNVRAIRDAEEQLRTAIGNAIFDAETAVKQAGADLAEFFYPDVPQQEVRQATERAKETLQQVSDDLGLRITQAFKDVTPEIGQRIHDLQAGDLYQQVLSNIGRRAGGRDLSGALRAAQLGTELLETLAGRFAFSATAMAQGATGLARFSGSAAHTTVLNVGHLFGHSFRPWQAVRFVSYLGRAAPFLSIGGALLGIATQVYSDRQDQKHSAQARQVRQGIRAESNKIAGQIAKEARERSAAAIQELLLEPLQQIETHRAELNTLRQDRNASLSRLGHVRAETGRLIKRIHEKSSEGRQDAKQGA